MRKLINVIIAGLMLVAAGVGSVHAATKLNFQVVFSRTGLFGQQMEYFAEKVGEYSNGEIGIKLYWPGQLISPKEGLSALQRGTIDGLGSVLLYYAGNIPEANANWVPYGWESSEELMEVYYERGYLAVLREAMAKHDVYFVAAIPSGGSSFLTRFPINTVEDIKGKKIRGTGIHGSIAYALGAAPIAMASQEQYVALQRGTMEGTVYPYVALETQKLYEVVDYVSLPAINNPGAVSITMGMKAWKKLTPFQQAAVDRAGVETAWRAALKSDRIDKQALDVAEKNKVKLNVLSPEEAKRIREIMINTLYKEHAAKSELCAKQVKILQDYWKEKGR